MFWDTRREEETFRFKAKLKPEIAEIKEIIEAKKPYEKADDIEERLSRITQQISLLSRYLSYVSGKTEKPVNKKVTREKELDELEKRIRLLKSKIERI